MLNTMKLKGVTLLDYMILKDINGLIMSGWKNEKQKIFQGLSFFGSMITLKKDLVHSIRFGNQNFCSQAKI